MLTKLPAYIEQLAEIDKKLSSPDIMKDMNAYKKLMMERSHVGPIVEEMQNLQELTEQLADAQMMLEDETDPDMIEMAKEELSSLKKDVETSTKNVRCF